MKYQIIGKRVEGNSIKRILGFILRVISLYFKIPKYDISLNHCSVWSIYTSVLRFKKNITITDNEIDHIQNKHLLKHVKYLIVPDAIPKEILINDNMDQKRIYQYHGFKEDIYLADYIPDIEFLKNLPIKDFVTIRPEVLDTTYVPKGISSIVPELLKELKERKIEVLFLYRYEYDKEYAKGFSNVYIPTNALNGLDVCYYSDAVLTGSGTLAREAACMGTPAVSFFPGTQLLAVDQKLIENGWLFHSRNSKKIIKYIDRSKKRTLELNRSKKVKKELIGILRNIIDDIQKQ
jgi:predicted glycosyltransferase